MGVALAGATWACGSRTQLDGKGDVRLSDAAVYADSSTPSFVTSSPACDASAKASTLLYEEPSGAIGQITLDSERIYWSGAHNDENPVALSMSKCGGAVVTLGDVVDYGDLVLPFGSNAYWVDGQGRVVHAPVAGGRVSALGISAGSIAAVDATSLYGMPPEPSMLSSSFVAIPLAGGPLAFLGTPSWPSPLAIDDANVYFPVGANPYDAQLAGVPKTGGPLQVLSAIPQGGLGAVTPSNIVLDDTRVYWGSGQEVIVSVLKSGGGQLILAEGRGSVAVDETYAYFFSLVGSPPEVIVNRVSKGGGSPEPVVDAGRLTADFGSIAVDARSIYWVELLAVPQGTMSRLFKLDL